MDEQKRIVLAANINHMTERNRRSERKNKQPIWNETVTTIYDFAKMIYIKWLAENASSQPLRPIVFVDNSAMKTLFAEEVRKHVGEYYFYKEEHLDEKTCEEFLKQAEYLYLNEPESMGLYKVGARVADLGKIHGFYKKMCEDWEKELKFTRASLLFAAFRVLKDDEKHLLLTEQEAKQYAFFRNDSLSYTEQEICRQIQARCGEVQDICVQNEITSLEELTNKPVIFSGYGILNEIRGIAETIIKNQFSFGDTAIYYTSDRYINFIAAELEYRGIPCRFVTGRTAKRLPIVELAIDLLEWAESEYSVDKLKAVFSNAELFVPDNVRRGIFKEVSWGLEGYRRYARLLEQKQSDEEMAEAECAQTGKTEREKKFDSMKFMNDLTAIFDKGDDATGIYNRMYDFINEHAKKGHFQSSERAVLKEKKATVALLKEMKGATAVSCLKKMLEEINLKEAGAADAVAVYKLYNTEYFERQNIFIAGLSANDFDVSNVESAVFLDHEIETCVPKNPQFASDRVSETIRSLKEALLTVDKDAKIYLSYSSFDTTQGAQQIKCTLLRDLERELQAAVSEHFGYELDNMEVNESRGCPDGIQSGNENETAEHVAIQSEADHEAGQEKDETKKFSASSMQELLKCPAQYIYEKCLGINVTEDLTIDPTIWLKANVRGTLYHSILENYFNKVTNNCTQALPEQLDTVQLNDSMERCIAKMLEQYPMTSEYSLETSKEIIRDCVKGYLENAHEEFCEQGWRVIGCEQKFNVDIPIGKDENSEEIILKFNGVIDRIDMRQEGDKKLLRVIDYKSGKYATIDDEIKNNELVQDYVYLCALSSLENLPGDKSEYDFSKTVMRFDFIEEEKKLLRCRERTLSVASECVKHMSRAVGILNKDEINPLGLFLEENKDNGDKDRRAHITYTCKYCKYSKQCKWDRRIIHDESTFI